MSIKVMGYSDDLIEVEGDFREEFYAYGEDEPNYLVFSDGTAVSIEYDGGGIWRIRVVRPINADEDTLTVAPVGDTDNYSDVYEWTPLEKITWCIHGKALSKGIG